MDIETLILWALKSYFFLYFLSLLEMILLTVYFAVQKLHFSVIDKRKIDVYRSQYEHQRWMEKENMVYLYKDIVSVRVTNVMNTMTKATWGGKSLFGLCFHITVHRWS